jgi:hypothetical protein
MYEALEPRSRQFRYFSLEPDLEVTRIRGTLRIFKTPKGVPLNVKVPQPKFEALSYEWGDPDKPRHEIIVDGQPFEVRENLFYALKCLRPVPLRDNHNPRILWIDAICINQDDVAERNHQVGIMGDIYRRADKVLVWISSVRYATEATFDLLAKLVVSSTTVEYHSLTKSGSDEENNLPSHGLDLDTSLEFGQLDFKPEQEGQHDWDAWDEVWEGLSTTPRSAWEGFAGLMERTYWTRIWIVQEYLLAKNIMIHCGLDSIDGGDLEKVLVKTLEFKQERHDNFPAHINQSIERIKNSAGIRITERRRDKIRRNLADLLETTKSSMCHDPHDRIYGILALADDLPQGRIPIDYQRSIFKVKMDVAWHFQQSLKSKADQSYVSQICSHLDEIFVNCPDDE